MTPKGGVGRLESHVTQVFQARGYQLGKWVGQAIFPFDQMCDQLGQLDLLVCKLGANVN